MINACFADKWLEGLFFVALLAHSSQEANDLRSKSFILLGTFTKPSRKRSWWETNKNRVNVNFLSCHPPARLVSLNMNFHFITNRVCLRRLTSQRRKSFISVWVMEPIRQTIINRTFAVFLMKLKNCDALSKSINDSRRSSLWNARGRASFWVKFLEFWWMGWNDCCAT